MKILIDMNLSPRWVDVFHDAGLDSVHWSQVGDPRAPDEQIMQWALTHDYVVFTHDLDFGAVLALTQAAGPSVLQVRAQDVLQSAMGAAVILALRRFERELSDGAIVIVDPSRSRARVLPIR